MNIKYNNIVRKNILYGNQQLKNITQPQKMKIDDNEKNCS